MFTLHVIRRADNSVLFTCTDSREDAVKDSCIRWMSQRCRNMEEARTMYKLATSRPVQKPTRPAEPRDAAGTVGECRVSLSDVGWRCLDRQVSQIDKNIGYLEKLPNNNNWLDQAIADLKVLRLVITQELACRPDWIAYHNRAADEIEQSRETARQ